MNTESPRKEMKHTSRLMSGGRWPWVPELARAQSLLSGFQHQAHSQHNHIKGKALGDGEEEQWGDIRQATQGITCQNVAIGAGHLAQSVKHYLGRLCPICMECPALFPVQASCYLKAVSHCLGSSVLATQAGSLYWVACSLGLRHWVNRWECPLSASQIKTFKEV